MSHGADYIPLERTSELEATHNPQSATLESNDLDELKRKIKSLEEDLAEKTRARDDANKTTRFHYQPNNDRGQPKNHGRHSRRSLSPKQRYSDRRSHERRSPDRRSLNRRSLNRRSHERRSHERRSPDRRSPDRRSLNRRSTDRQSMRSRSPDRRDSTYVRASERRNSQERRSLEKSKHSAINETDKLYSIWQRCTHTHNYPKFAPFKNDMDILNSHGIRLREEDLFIMRRLRQAVDFIDDLHKNRANIVIRRVLSDPVLFPSQTYTAGGAARFYQNQAAKIPRSGRAVNLSQEAALYAAIAFAVINKYTEHHVS